MAGWKSLIIKFQRTNEETLFFGLRKDSIKSEQKGCKKRVFHVAQNEITKWLTCDWDGGRKAETLQRTVGDTKHSFRGTDRRDSTLR